MCHPNEGQKKFWTWVKKRNSELKSHFVLVKICFGQIEGQGGGYFLRWKVHNFINYFISLVWRYKHFEVRKLFPIKLSRIVQESIIKER